MASEAEFWKWSLKKWGEEGVETQLLELQDDHQLVVLEILMAAWLGSLGIRLSEGGWQAMTAAADPWVAGVVLPLRERRIAWRGHGEHQGLYSEVKKLELAAERSLASIYVEALAEMPDFGAAQPGQAALHTGEWSLSNGPIAENLAWVLSRAHPSVADEHALRVTRLLGA